MKRKKTFRSILAFLCVISMSIGSFAGHLGTVFANVSTTESLPTDFTSVTPRDFGLAYTCYPGVETEHTTTRGAVTRPSMHEVRFDTMLTMGKDSILVYLRSSTDDWTGLQFRMSDNDTKLWLQNGIKGSDGLVWIDGSSTNNCRLSARTALGEDVTSFLDKEFHLSITTENWDVDGDGGKDIKLGVWFNEKLYNEQFFYIKDAAEVVEPTMLLVRYSGDIVLDNPNPEEPVETTESYNLADGNYLVAGNGTITVNGEEVENGTVLSEPGVYKIVSDDGRMTRYVTLTNEGKKSQAITYEDGVMPIVGYHGPYNTTDDRGTKHHLITDATYQKLSEAGFNLISKIERDWNSLSTRVQLEKSLEYAEKYGIGLYLRDDGVKGDMSATELAERLALYSDYQSFKGIYVADEPRTENYATSLESHVLLSDVSAEAKNVNQYCNLDAYVNLFPDMGSKDEDFPAYLEECSTETGGKYLSYDYYAFGKTYTVSKTTGKEIVSRSNIKDYFKNLSSVRNASVEKEIPFWPFVQVGNYWNGLGKDEDTQKQKGFTIEEDGSPSREQLLWNVNTSLAYGAKGIQYFPMVQPDYFAYEKAEDGYNYQRNGVLGANGEPTKWYPHVQEANEQIGYVDEYLLKATSKEVLAEGNAAESDTAINKEAYGTLEGIDVSDTAHGAVVGAFDYNGNDMFYVVNYDTTDTTQNDTITLNFSKIQGYRMIQDGETTYGYSKNCALSIPAGEAVLVIIEDTAVAGDHMTRITPENFGFAYTEYEQGAERALSCTDISSMDGVMFKTKISFESGTYLRYMKAGTGTSEHWKGVTFWMRDYDYFVFMNALTDSFVIDSNGDGVDETIGVNGGLQFNPGLALGDGITSWEGQTFDLTLTTEFIAYGDSAEADDLKLGIYFNDKLYKNTFVYILDCKDSCYSNLFLYCPSGAITLDDPVVFTADMQPVLTDSIDLIYRTVLVDVVTEAPIMTFERDGNKQSVAGVQKGATVWEFTYPEMYAQHMAETVTATLQLGDFTKTYQTSMLDYTAYVLEMEEGAYTAEQLMYLKNLMVDMMQYSAAVQQYRDHSISANSDALITNKLAALVPEYAQYDLEDDADLSSLTPVRNLLTGDSADTTYTWKSATLVLDDKVMLRYKFAAESVDSLKIIATIRGQAYEISPTWAGNDTWYVDVDSINAYEYDEPMSLQFYENGKQVGKTLNYSVNTYLKTMNNSVVVDKTLWSQLLLAIHNYGTAAQQYQDVK